MHPRTPSSILRKRANKENAGREGRRKLPGRRVSFAPDDELETMHLYQKDRDKSAQQSPMDQNMPITEELAARIPLALQEQNIAAQGNWASDAQHNGQSNGVCGTALQQSLLSMMSPSAMMSPMSMDLTNNSADMMQQHPVGFTAGNHRPAGGNGLSGFEFTTSITSAVPALSTLIEEDEDSGLEASHAGPNRHINKYDDRDNSNHYNAAAYDNTVSMELTEPVAAVAGTGNLRTALEFESPARQPLPEQATTAGGGMYAAGEMTPTSPFALNEMLQHRGDSQSPAEEGSDILKNKWGFTPGADDTLNISQGHGRKVMGDTTFNHVYGSSTMGDITLAMKANTTAGVLGMQQQQAGARPLAFSRSSVAATANAGMEGMRLSGTGAHRQSDVHPHEMTINLLADDQAKADNVWPDRYPTAAAAAAAISTLTGHASVASSRPASEPCSLAADEGAGMVEANGSTTALLAGSFVRQGAQQKTNAALGLINGGRPAGNITRTMNDWTAQLLAEGATTAPPLAAFMQQQQQQLQANGIGQSKQTMQKEAQPHGRDDTTSAMSGRLEAGRLNVMSGPGSQRAGGGSQTMMPDATVASLDFQLAAAQQGGNTGTGSLFGDGAHTLDDFAMPPDLQPTGGASQQDMNQQPTSQPMARLSGAASSAGYQDAAAAPHGGRALPPASPAPMPRQQVHTAMDGGMMHSQSQQLSQGIPQDGSYSQQQQEPQPVVPPLTFHEFLGLVEIRFLDDIRRRTSMVQPFDMGLLAPRTKAAAPAYPEALQNRFVTGAATKLQNDAINELAERVESLQKRAQQRELQITRNNPPLFRDIQLADNLALDALKAQMGNLKRLCRHKTLLAWKKTRLDQEQQLNAVFNDVAVQLQAEAASIQAACQQGEQLETEMDQALASLQQSTQRLQDQAREHESTLQHDKQVEVRAKEVAEANEHRRRELTELAARRDALQAQYEDVLQKKAEARQQLQAMNGQGILKSTPDKTAGLLAASTPAAGQTLTAPERRVSQLQTSLNILLAIQGLHLDLRQPCSAGSSADWAVIVQGQLRVVVSANQHTMSSMETSNTSAMETNHDQHIVVVEPTAQASQLCCDVAYAYFGATPECVGRQLVLERVRALLQQATAVCDLAVQLEDLMLSTQELVQVSVDTSREGQTQPEVMFTLVSTGKDGAQQHPCKACLRVACTDQLLHGQCDVIDTTTQVIIPSSKAPALTASLQATLSAKEERGLQSVVGALTRWMRAFSASGQAPSDACIPELLLTPTRAVSPLLRTNPLFGAMES